MKSTKAKGWQIYLIILQPHALLDSTQQQECKTFIRKFAMSKCGGTSSVCYFSSCVEIEWCGKVHVPACLWLFRDCVVLGSAFLTPNEFLHWLKTTSLGKLYLRKIPLTFLFSNCKLMITQKNAEKKFSKIEISLILFGKYQYCSSANSKG